MIQLYNGQITENLYVAGNYGAPAFLLTGENPALFDAGVGLMGPVYMKDLQCFLGDAGKLRYVFLTHSHFDHCGSVPYLKKKIPGLQTGANKVAGDIFLKSSAVALIRDLNNSMAGNQPDEIIRETEFITFKLNFPFYGGEEFELGNGLSFRVIATPGHTRDSVSYYIPRMKVLIAGEAAGLFDKAMNIMPEFLSSYTDYVESLEKMVSLDIDYLLPAHGYYLTGDNTGEFLRNSIASAKQFRERILNYLHQYNGDCSSVVEKIYQEDYVATGNILQPARAYLLNLEAQVRGIAADASAP
jgi:2-aminobenzoylacetyl-CoA thioesterase